MSTVDLTVGAFEEECRRFLEANALPKPERSAFAWGEGSDDVSILEELSPQEEAARVTEAKAWLARRFDAGLGWISGPEEFGGRGLPPAYQRLYERLEAQFETPDQSAFGIGLGITAQVLLAHGQAATQAYVPAMFRGDLIACQLFSEPGAGSDLAGVETKAVRDGDRWVISGQKVWTSGAHLSDVGEILCRTNREIPKHQGLTAFVVDMHAPGVVVRPLRQMTGGASFDEVFFDEVIVPDDHRLGDVDGGWSVVITTLLHERSSIGAGALGESDPSLVSGARLRAMLRHLGRDDDPVLRQSLAKVYTGFQVARWTNARALARTADGVPPGPEMSLAKLAFSRNLTATAEFVADALGPHIAADTGEWGTFAWANFLLSAPGTRIGGGTDEVQRTIIGDRVLGLPKEPR